MLGKPDATILPDEPGVGQRGVVHHARTYRLPQPADPTQPDYNGNRDMRHVACRMTASPDWPVSITEPRRTLPDKPTPLPIPFSRMRTMAVNRTGQPFHCDHLDVKTRPDNCYNRHASQPPPVATLGSANAALPDYSQPDSTG